LIKEGGSMLIDICVYFFILFSVGSQV
jgi:hypothetical protein